MRAASAIAAGSQPASWMADGLPSSAAMRIVLRFSRMMAQEAIISETTRPWRCSRAHMSCTSRRNGRSVTPDMGARTTGVSRRIGPIAMGASMLMI